MYKKLLSLILSVVMLTALAGCMTKSTTSEVYYDEYVDGEGSYISTGSKNETGSDGTGGSGSSGAASDNKGNSSGKNEKKPSSGISANHQSTNTGKGDIKFTPVADSGANYNVKGDVVIAVDTGRVADYDAMFDIMQKLYPNVNVKFDYWTHTNSDSAAEYLSTRAATGNMADIIWDDAGCLPSYIMQGWVYPITKYVNADPEAKNIPQNLKDDYTYCGELYAVPHQAHFDSVVFNVDLLNKLGLKLPNMSWNYDDFEKYLRGAAAKYKDGMCVGTDSLAEIYSEYATYLGMSVNNKDNKNNYGQWGFNLKTNTIDNDYIIKGAQQYFKWRTMVPGVDASYEAYQKGSDGTSQLESYLGNTTNIWMGGKALLHIQNTAGVLQDESSLTFKYAVRPLPNQNGHLAMHVDECFITSACKKENIDAAFQLLRFMTYSTNGNLARLSMYEKSEQGKYALNSRIYYPTTKSTEVIKKFNNLYCVTDTDKYLVANIPNSSRFDMHKLIPNMYDTFIGNVGTSLNSVRDGKDDGSSMKEPIDKFNAAVKKTISNMNTSIQKVQKDFNSKH